MKTNIAKVLSLNIFLFIIGANYVIAQNTDRGSVWVHGLNGGTQDWQKWEQLFTLERKLGDNAGSPQEYNTKLGVNNTASLIDQSQLSLSQNEKNNTIYFGHSNGGVVARELDVNFSKNFGGCITLGSPFDGAKISNSATNGQADAFISNGVNKVGQGLARQFGVAWYFIWDIEVSDLIANKISAIYRKAGLNNDRGAIDLQEGSAYMNSAVRNTTTNTPKINIYGNENGPVFWHYFSSYRRNEGNLPTSDDTKYVNLASTAGDIWNGMMWVNIGAAAATGWWTFGIGAIYYSWVADGWAQGRDWWRYDSENGWNSLIGANTSSYRTISYSTFDYNRFYQCMYNGSGYGSYGYTYNRYSECSQQATSYNTYYYYSPVNGQSDGFIKAPSQTGYNSDWNYNATKIEALGVNHIEMLDNPKIQDIFNSILDGNADGGGQNSFFFTRRK